VASAEKQAAFIAIYERLMRECQQMKPSYFADAVHPGIPDQGLRFGWVKVDQRQRFSARQGAGGGGVFPPGV